MRNGYGKLQRADGESYEGYFKLGRYDGRGKRRGRDGSGFDGYYLDGLEHGRGRLLQKGGCMFDGTWLHGKRQGRGITHMASGERQEANYENGKLIGSPRIFFGRPDLSGTIGVLTRSVPRFTGCALALFMQDSDRPVRLKLHVTPAWLMKCVSGEGEGAPAAEGCPYESSRTEVASEMESVHSDEAELGPIDCLHAAESCVLNDSTSAAESAEIMLSDETEAGMAECLQTSEGCVTNDSIRGTDTTSEPLAARVAVCLILHTEATPSAYCHPESYDAAHLSLPEGDTARQLHIRVHCGVLSRKVKPERLHWAVKTTLSVAPLLEWTS